MISTKVFTLLYDGTCPICQKEVDWLRRQNKQGKLGFQDIHAEDFDPTRLHKTIPELMAEIHGIYPDGLVIKGMPVFRATYTAVGLGWLMAPTGWPILRQVFDALYAWFARHRLNLGRYLASASCRDGLCQTPPNSD